MARIKTSEARGSLPGTATPKTPASQLAPSVAAASKFAGAAGSIRVPQVTLPKVNAQAVDTSAISGAMFKLAGISNQRKKQRDAYRDKVEVAGAYNNLAIGMTEWMDKNKNQPVGLVPRMKTEFDAMREGIVGSLTSQKAVDAFNSRAGTAYISNFQYALGIEARAASAVEVAKFDGALTGYMAQITADPTIDKTNELQGEAESMLKDLVDGGYLDVNTAAGSRRYDSYKKTIEVGLKEALINELIRTTRYKEAQQVLNDTPQFGADRLMIDNRIKAYAANDVKKAKAGAEDAMLNLRDTIEARGPGAAPTRDLIIKNFAALNKDDPRKVDEFYSKIAAAEIKYKFDNTIYSMSPEQAAVAKDAIRLTGLPATDAAIAAGKQAASEKLLKYNEMVRDKPADAAARAPEFQAMNAEYARLGEALQSSDPELSGMISAQLSTHRVNMMKAYMTHQSEVYGKGFSEMQALPTPYLADIAAAVNSEDPQTAVGTIASLRASMPNNMYSLMMRNVAELEGTGVDIGFPQLFAAETIDDPAMAQKSLELFKLDKKQIAGELATGKDTPDKIFSSATSAVFEDVGLMTVLEMKASTTDTGTAPKAYRDGYIDMMSRHVVDRMRSQGLSERNALKQLSKELTSELHVVDDNRHKYVVPKRFNGRDYSEFDVIDMNNVLDVMTDGVTQNPGLFRHNPYYMNNLKGRNPDVAIDALMLKNLPIDPAKVGLDTQEQLERAYAHTEFRTASPGVIGLWVKNKEGGKERLRYKVSGRPVEFTYDQLKDLNSRYLSEVSKYSVENKQDRIATGFESRRVRR